MQVSLYTHCVPPPPHHLLSNTTVNCFQKLIHSSQKYLHLRSAHPENTLEVAALHCPRGTDLFQVCLLCLL